MLHLSVAALDTPQSTIEEAALVIDGERIAAVGAASRLSAPKGARRLELPDLRAVPGLIDIQLNGGFGSDFTQRPESIWEVAEQLPRFGVTSFLPTIITSPEGSRRRAMDSWAAGPPDEWIGARPLGLHLEGPFLAPAKKGAHDAAELRSPDPRLIANWTRERGIRYVTLAPELPGALEMIRELRSRGIVVSSGHSSASFAQAMAGFDAGVQAVTHIFNAMPPLHHREPGLTLAALSHSGVMVGLIPDGIHLHPQMVALVARLAGTQRLSLVSDAMAAMGMAPGRYDLASLEVVVDENSARLRDGTLAGSIITLDEALRRFMSYSGWNLAQALSSVTQTPASLFDEERGGLVAGRIADVLLIDEENRVTATYCAGKLAWCAPERRAEILP